MEVEGHNCKKCIQAKQQNSAKYKRDCIKPYTWRHTAKGVLACFAYCHRCCCCRCHCCSTWKEPRTKSQDAPPARPPPSSWSATWRVVLLHIQQLKICGAARLTQRFNIKQTHYGVPTGIITSSSMSYMEAEPCCTWKKLSISDRKRADHGGGGALLFTRELSPSRPTLFHQFSSRYPCLLSPI